eukprot:EG_transcript_14326
MHGPPDVGRWPWLAVAVGLAVLAVATLPRPAPATLALQRPATTPSVSRVDHTWANAMHGLPRLTRHGAVEGEGLPVGRNGEWNPAAVAPPAAPQPSGLSAASVWLAAAGCCAAVAAALARRPSPSARESVPLPLGGDSSPTKGWGASVAATAMAVGAALAPVALDAAVVAPPALAAEKRVLAEIDGSGFLFKDKLRVEAFEDPKIPGVTLYLSDFERPLTEKLQKDFFSDPTSAGLTCAAQGALVPKEQLPAVEEVFNEAKSLFTKSLRVDRVYDAKQRTVLYVAYSTRLDKSEDSNKSRFKSSLCAVPLASRPATPADSPPSLAGPAEAVAP